MIKLSAADWCFFKPGMDPAGYYGKLAEMGYSGVEMVAPERFAAAQAAGLAIVNLMSARLEKGLNHRENHEWLIPMCLEIIALAGENKIPHVIIYSGMREGQADADGLQICREAIERLLPAARRHNVTLVFEMLNDTDHPDYQADHGAYGFDLWKTVGSPQVKLLYDIYHMAMMGDDCGKDVTANLDAIAHIHIAEKRGRGLPLAGGKIKYADLVPSIVRAGYQGYWGMEFEPKGDAFAELKAAAWLFNSLV